MTPSLTLFLPPDRQVLPDLLQAQAVSFIATEDRLDDVRREAGQAEHAADGVGQVFEAWLALSSDAALCDTALDRSGTGRYSALPGLGRAE